MLIGEDEYHTWETLPAFADQELRPRGDRVTVIQQDKMDKNHFPGLIEALPQADLLVLSVRRRTLPKAELDAVRAYLEAGHPLVGIRTACHAFAVLPGATLTVPGAAVWPGFDPEVLGGHYTGHSHLEVPTVVSLAPQAADSPILAGVSAARLVSPGNLYHVAPLEAGTMPLLIGTIPGEAPQPVAWTHRYGPHGARIFYTSLGSPEDFKNPDFRRLLANSIAWGLR